MTPAEQADFDALQQSAAAAQATTNVHLANETTVQAALTSRFALIRTARTAIANGNLFASLSANEKAVIDGLLLDDLYLGRLALELYDSTT